ncbi:MAG TPA: pyrimidine/purine nucleoside phosphorylase [Candidatus Fimivivens sp.]|nr:pyrimidine/purine nucleoside phosphorylase [Candidatus Fimivivens sp.]
MSGQQKYGIKPNMYFDGRLQSYRYRNEETGQDESVGVATPFAYDFKIAREREVMTVTSGIIEAHDSLHSPDHDPTFIFEKGERIKFCCSVTSSYLCVFGEPMAE